MVFLTSIKNTKFGEWFRKFHIKINTLIDGPSTGETMAGKRSVIIYSNTQFINFIRSYTRNQINNNIRFG